MSRRDIVVIGSSLGGVEALGRLIPALPPDLPAAVLVVQHVGGGDHLAELLDRRSALPVVTAADGMTAEPGRVVVAPANRHMLLTETGIRVVYGPRENRSRPAIDALFRTAAVYYRSRVVGVVLTGLLADGAAGLSAVIRCGGVGLVQDPSEAAYSDMPTHALLAARAAVQVTLDTLPERLRGLTAEPAPAPPEVPKALEIEARLTQQATATEDWSTLPSAPTDLVCGECHGPLREVREDGRRRYRCRVGHAFSSEDLLGSNRESIEQALWVALQTLQERARLLERMAEDDDRRGWHRAAADTRERADELHLHGARLRLLLEDLDT